MADNFNIIIDHLIFNEGGYSNDKFDRGGKTIWGVTKTNWEAYTGRTFTKNEFKSLEPRDVKEFYKTQYWDNINGDQLPTGLDYCVFDFAVNSGVSRSAKFLQHIVGVAEDGVIGNVTLSATYEYISLFPDPKIGVKKLVDSIMYDRKQFLKTLKTFWRFGRGWLNRIESVTNKCYELIEEPPRPEVRDLAHSRTIKASKRQTMATVATGGIAAAGGVESVSKLPAASQVVSDLQTINTVASGFSGIMSYGFYIGIAVIIFYALYQAYLRYEDWFTGERE